MNNDLIMIMMEMKKRPVKKNRCLRSLNKKCVGRKNSSQLFMHVEPGAKNPKEQEQAETVPTLQISSTFNIDEETANIMARYIDKSCFTASMNSPPQANQLDPLVISKGNETAESFINSSIDRNFTDEGTVANNR